MKIDAPCATVAGLKDALTRPFGRTKIETMLGQMRDDGLLEPGMKGRNGSAAVTPRQAVLAVLALAFNDEGSAVAAIEDAQRAAEYQLIAIDRSGPDRDRREFLPDAARITLLSYMIAELEALRGAHPDYEPRHWVISRSEVTQGWRDRLVFSGVPCVGVERIAVVPASVIKDVAGLFPPLAPALPGEALTARLDAMRDVQAAA